jgi:hypothetical protein
MSRKLIAIAIAPFLLGLAVTEINGAGPVQWRSGARQMSRLSQAESARNLRERPHAVCYEALGRISLSRLAKRR